LVDFRGSFPAPNPLRARVFISVFLKILIEPAATIASGLDTEFSMNFEIWPWFESPDFFFTTSQHRQRLCLDPARCGHLKSASARVVGDQGTGGVDADKPVALRSGSSGV